MTTYQIRINTLALAARMPTFYSQRERVEAGGLMSHGPNFPDLFRRAGDYVDKILRGVKPAEIPVEQPTKFDLMINLTTAKALGLAIPDSFLLRADEVLEGAKAPAKLARSAGVSPAQVRPSKPPGSECCVRRLRRRTRSVHSGCGGWGIE